MNRRLAGLVALLAAAALVSCSSPEEHRTAQNPSADAATDAGSVSGGTDSNANDAAQCADVWQVGKDLPANYNGCRQDDGSTVMDDGYACADGSHITSYDGVDPRLFAITGQKIQAMTNSEFVDYLVGICKP